ncbi:DUF192 domain-containing protein [candidate division WOR-3 bacterium]|nr:DUF192 domain-containing protein [candidate division WOR-3 bacterium]
MKIRFVILCFVIISCRGPVERELQNEDFKPDYYGLSFEKTLIVVGDETLSVEIADDENERSLGLMYRDSLQQNAGMLFVFDRPTKLYFWMKNTKIELDIAFIDSSMVIMEIESLIPYSTENVASDFDAKYALEVNRGWFKERNIVFGDKIKFTE